MCLPGCQEAVHRALSRRSLFAGLGATALTAIPVAPAAARPTTFNRVIDLTHVLSENFPTFSGAPGITVTKKLDLAKDGYNLNEWTLSEHTGTHLDAPLHFSKNGRAAHALAAETLVAPLVVIDISEQAEADPDYRMTSDDVAAFERANGPIPQGACVALRSGWGRHVGTEKFRNPDANDVLHFPGFRPDLAQVFLDKGVIGVVVDTLSLDHGISKDFGFHVAWLGAGRWGVEAAANLEAVPETGATIIVGAPKVEGATGGPARIFALV